MLIIILKILRKLNLLGFFNLSVKVRNIRIPIIGGIGFGNLRGTEKWMTEIIELLLNKSNDCFLDVGVNIGQTLIKLKSINRDIEYIGFEPNPLCVFYSERLIKLNKFPNTKIIPAGISNVNQIVSLLFYSDNQSDSSASIVNNFRSVQSVIQEKNIVVLTGDLIKIESKISILKIDVEGAELMVIEGLIEILKKDRPYIIIEILPVYSLENQDRLLRQNEILRITKDLDYSIFKIVKKPDDTLQELIEISEIPIHSDLTQCDYVFAPNEKRDLILKSKISA